MLWNIQVELTMKNLQRLSKSLFQNTNCIPGLDKETLKALCDLASNEADRKLVRVAATAGLSGVQAKATFGISNLHKERKKVAEAVQEYASIRKKVDDIVNAKMSAFLESCVFGDTDSDSGDEYCQSGMSEEPCSSDTDDQQKDNDVASENIVLPYHRFSIYCKFFVKINSTGYLS